MTDSPIANFQPKAVIATATFEKVMEKALGLLARRAYTRAELRTKLLEARYPKVLAEAVVEDCIRLRYVDDAEYLATFVQGQLKNGYGRLKIAQRLKEHRFPEPLIREVLATLDDSEAMVLAYQQRQKSFMASKTYFSACEKILRYLVGRGFPMGNVRNFVKTCTELKTLPMHLPPQVPKVPRAILPKTRPVKPPSDPVALLKKQASKLLREPDLFKRKNKAFLYLVSHGIDFDTAKSILENDTTLGLKK